MQMSRHHYPLTEAMHRPIRFGRKKSTSPPKIIAWLRHFTCQFHRSRRPQSSLSTARGPRFAATPIRNWPAILLNMVYRRRSGTVYFLRDRIYPVHLLLERHRDKLELVVLPVHEFRILSSAAGR